MTSEPVPPRLAATLVLVRAIPGAPFETLMVVRHEAMSFAPGAMVFPGGGVDFADHRFAQEFPEHCNRAGHEAADLAIRVAAIRETFEESGILLAHEKATGQLVSGGSVERIVSEYRQPLCAGDLSFSDMVRQEGLVLAADLLVPFARWITPASRPKRFDTHFYLAEAPVAQSLIHDGNETVEAVWIAPQRAIEENRKGRCKLVFPTRMNLIRLSQAGSTEEAIALAQATPVVTVMPEYHDTPDGKAIRIPAEAGYGGDLFPVIDPPSI